MSIRTASELREQTLPSYAVLASGYVHLDATPIDGCDPARPGEARSATVWAYRARRSPDPERDGLVWFDYRATKSPAEPSAVLRAAHYRGVVQTDGAAGLDALAPPEVITHLGCWAHARRYVVTDRILHGVVVER